MEHDRILGYFLEEASEHLHTIEQGLGKLPETVRQPTTIRELFRAAHSIKGSAAMLGLNDVRQVSDRFEANFKLLKEHPQITVDRHLQTLFLDSFNFLRAAIEEVRQSSDPYRRDPASPDPVGDPVFEELKSYLQHLLGQSESVAPTVAPTSAIDMSAEPALEQVFGEYVTRKLGEIAELCLQIDRPETRSQIQKICQKLGDLGENFEFLEWSNLFAACRLAIANPHNTLHQLGQSITIAVKQAQILVLSGRAATIGIPSELTTLIERQGRVAQPPDWQAEPFKVDNPHDPFASRSIASEGTTQQLDLPPTVSTEPLPAPMSPVFSTITNSVVATNELPPILSQSLTEHLSELDTSNAPFDLTASSDEFVNLSAEDESDFDSNNVELNDFMNALDGEMAGDGTWMTDDDLFELNDTPALDLSDLVSTPVIHPLPTTSDVQTPELVSAGSALVESEYDEETFYTPDLGDLHDGDMVSFWADDRAIAPQQSLYSAFDLPDNLGARFEPDSSPALELDIAQPKFTLDTPMSDLFLTIAPITPDPDSDGAARFAAADLFGETDLPDGSAEPNPSLSAMSAPETDPEPIAIDSWEAELPNSPIASNLTSDILYLEEIESRDRPDTAVSEADELNDWIDFSMEQSEAPVFTDVDLNQLNSTDASGNFANIDPATTDVDLDRLNSPDDLGKIAEIDEPIADVDAGLADINAATTDIDLERPNSLDEIDDVADINAPIDDYSQPTPTPTVNIDELDFNNLAEAVAPVAAASDEEFGFDFPSLSDDRLDNLGGFDISANAEDPLQIGAEDPDRVGLELQELTADPIAPATTASQIGELDFNFSTNDIAELESALDREPQLAATEPDFAAIDALDLQPDAPALDLPVAQLDSDLGAIAFDFAATDDLEQSFASLAMPEAAGNFGVAELHLSDADDRNADENDISVASLDLDTPIDLSAPLDLIGSIDLGSDIAELPPSSTLDNELAAVDLDRLLDTSSVAAQTDDLAALDLDLASGNLSVDLAQMSNFDDLSELEFALDDRSADLSAIDLPDLDAVLAAPTTELADVGSLDALLGGAAIGASVGAFDALDDLISTSTPAVALEDLDLLLGTPAPVASIAAPITTTDKKTTDRRAKQRTFEQTMRVSVRYLDNLSNLVGELVVNRNTLEQDQNRMRQFVEKLLSEVQKLNEVGKRMQDLYERSLMENSLVASRQQNKPTAAPSSVPANLQDLEQTGTLMEYDPLEMDRFTPIHLLSQKMIELTVRIRESTADIEFVVDDSTEVTRTLRQITGQLQEDLTKSRMVPFAQTADRLQRGVREHGLKYGKQIELSVDGRDTLIDKVILESLTDPLNHMVNNSIAHGIESAEVRQAAGKPIEGQITIRAIHQGNQTIISISDDGAGIDTERVKAKAIEKGMIAARQAATMSKADAYELLFLPSFSTKDEADELAGRGVGMDVVRTSLTEIRGTITTESQLGIGTTFTIRLPLALSIAKALIAVNNKTNIAFPMDGVEDTQDVSPEQIQTDRDGEQCIFWRDELMPFKPLSDLLGYNRPLSRNNFYGAHEDDSDLISILILRSDGNLIAVQVDKIVSDQEIVIKPLQGPAPKPLGIAGATVLGDGRIVPIADVMELIALSNGTLTRQVPTQLANRIATPTVELRESMVLIVDDSITVRELLSLTFKRAGYRVEQARDGQEAWDKLRAGLPCDIVFCDIEMPRMDGLEFLSRVQKDAALKQVPVAMLTSRGSDRHRQIASQLGASGYFIKPYLEEALLDAAKRMIQGEVLAIV
jgi:chemotaxis protein histidine kinase CheA/ActR/RegA family two-component response regulator